MKFLELQLLFQKKEKGFENSWAIYHCDSFPIPHSVFIILLFQIFPIHFVVIVAVARYLLVTWPDKNKRKAIE